MSKLLQTFKQDAGWLVCLGAVCKMYRSRLLTASESPLSIKEEIVTGLCDRIQEQKEEITELKAALEYNTKDSVNKKELLAKRQILVDAINCADGCNNQGLVFEDNGLYKLYEKWTGLTLDE